MHRAAALPRVRSVPRAPRAVVWALATLTLLVAGLLWLRDASVVAVNHVTVTGLTGPEAGRVGGLLESAARDMTTLHVRTDQLRAVVENTPVAAIVVDGTRTPVSGDGRLLTGAEQRELPVVPLPVAPGGTQVLDRTARQAIAVLAAAPPALRARVLRASSTRQGGLTLTLRNGPDLRFGGADRIAAKWAAATAVLADPGSAGASYLDLRYPERPAAGGLEDPSTQRDPQSVNSADPAATTTPVTPAPGITP
jgi:cell division protein FtsQ